MKTCIHEGCDKIANAARGLCSTHYRKQQRSRLYNIWMRMRSRCNNPNHQSYQYYGGKGITIDPRWDSFQIFKQEIGEPPTSRHTLDRIDSNKGYYASNCRWATRKEQAQNRSSCKLSTWSALLIRAEYIPGKVKQSDLAEKYGVCRRNISLILRNLIWS